MADSTIYGIAENKSLKEVYGKDKTDDLLDGKANSSHNHSAANITSGSLSIARGGTGASNVATAQKNLGVDENYIILNLSANYNLTTSLTKIPFNEINHSKGDLLTMSNNGVRVGEGVTKVKISANLRLYPRTAADTSNQINVYKNSTNMTYVGTPNIGGANAIATFAEYEIGVTEGDVIYLYAQTSTANVGRIGVNTQFKVEVLR